MKGKLCITWTDQKSKFESKNEFSKTSNIFIYVSCFNNYTALKTLANSRNKDLRGACTSALWQINADNAIADSQTAPPPSYEEAINEPEPVAACAKSSFQVMLSYQWDSKTRVLHIKDKLLEAGYKVWIDVKDMSKLQIENGLFQKLNVLSY